jgi:acyl dehydratase
MGYERMTEFHVEVGETTSFTKTVSESDVYMFAGITGDFSPNHVNRTYMENSKYGRRMAHGALLIGFISAVSTLAIAGCRSNKTETPVAVGMDKIRFLCPVFIDDTVTVNYKISETDLKKRRSYAQVEVYNQDDILVCVTTHILQWVKNE